MYIYIYIERERDLGKRLHTGNHQSEVTDDICTAAAAATTTTTTTTTITTNNPHLGLINIPPLICCLPKHYMFHY